MNARKYQRSPNHQHEIDMLKLKAKCTLVILASVWIPLIAFCTHFDWKWNGELGTGLAATTGTLTGIWKLFSQRT